MTTLRSGARRPARALALALTLASAWLGGCSEDEGVATAEQTDVAAAGTATKPAPGTTLTAVVARETLTAVVEPPARSRPSG